MKKPVLFIDKKEFIEWYFDNDAIYNIGTDAVNELEEKGEFKVSLDYFVRGVRYLPVSLILNKEVIQQKENNR